MKRVSGVSADRHRGASTARAAGPKGTTAQLLALSRTAGNQAVVAHLAEHRERLPYRRTMELAFGEDFSGVRVRTGQGAELASLGADAAAEGDTIAFASEQPDRQVVAHELAHVVQQRRAGTSTVARRSVVAPAHDPAELEADRLAPLAAAGARVEVRERPTAAVHLKRSYASFGATDVRTAQIDAKAEADYHEKAAEFEQKLGEAAAKHPAATKIAGAMLDRIADLVDAWAAATGLEVDRLLEQHLSWGGAGYGAVPAMARDIKKVIGDRKQNIPIREKLTLVYAAIRNNSLAMWLRAAAEELTTTGQQVSIPGYQAPGSTTKAPQPVKRGFAAESALDRVLQGKVGPGGSHQALIASERGKDAQAQSGLLDQTAAQQAADLDRVGIETNANKAYRRLRAKDIKGLTSREMRQGMTADPRKKLSWMEKRAIRRSKREMRSAPGSQWYRIKVESTTAQQARQINALLLAGISGSTDLMLHAAQWLGIDSDEDKKALRLAILGWMLPARDHSWYEVMKAAEGYGVPFTDPPDGYADIPPMTQAELLKLLPKEGGRHVLPKHYLSAAHKDKLAQSWLPSAKVAVAADRIGPLVQQGVPRGMLEALTPAALKAAADLASASAKATFVTAGGDAAKQAQNDKAYGALKASSPMRALSKASPAKARLILAVLVEQRLSGSDFRPPAQDGHAELVRAAAVMKADVDTAGTDKQKTGPQLNSMPGTGIAWGGSVATGHLDANVLKANMSQAAQAPYRGLHAKERGAIHAYSGSSYKEIVPAMGKLQTGGADATVTKQIDRIEAITSGLMKLPRYQGTAYRLEATGIGQWFTALRGSWNHREKLLKQRLDVRYSPGQILTYPYPLSSTKDLANNFGINTSTGKMDVVLVIDGVKSGRDVQVLSAQYGEAEVLFPPGARFVVTRYEHNLDVPEVSTRLGKENAPDTDRNKDFGFERAKIFVYCREV